MTSGPPKIWVLLGRRAGDNRQLVALANATELPWTPKPLAFADLTKRRASLAGSIAALSAEAQAELAAPWPEVALASGRWSAPVALAIRTASGGKTRLVHLGRPWAPLAWFDLVITTAQYGLPERANVLVNFLPLTAPTTPADAAAPDLDALPRPRLAVLVGGDSPPRILDAAAARALATAALARVKIEGGSLLVATSPRTSPEAASALRDALACADAPVKLSIFGEGENAYRAFLSAADAFLVTDDSAAMVAEAAMAGAPVTLHPLPRRPSAAQRRVAAIRAAAALTPATQALFDRLVERGLVTSIRDLDLYFDGLRRAGLLAGGDAACRAAAEELARAADRVRTLAGAAPTN